MPPRTSLSLDTSCKAVAECSEKRPHPARVGTFWFLRETSTQALLIISSIPVDNLDNLWGTP
jgi:hypothetical protein